MPPPFNAPMVLWDACAACCAGVEERGRLVRMEFERYEDDEMFGAPELGGTLQGGTPLSRKFVQRYLKRAAELSAEQATTRQVEKMVTEMEDRMNYEFEHVKTMLGSSAGGNVDRQLKHIIAGVDRLSRGEVGKHAAKNVEALKQAVRDGSGGGGGSGTPTHTRTSPPPRGKSMGGSSKNSTTARHH